MCVCGYIFSFFILQHVKAQAISCPHQPPTRGVNTVSVAQGGTATPGTTKQLLSLEMVFKRIIYIYIYIYIYVCIYARSTKGRDYIARSSSFLVQFVIFKNMSTFSRWCHYMLTLTISWCHVIIREWWFRVHFIHAKDFSLLTKSNFMHSAPWSNGTSTFSVPNLGFPSVLVFYSVVFLWFYLFYALLHQTTPNTRHI